MDNIDNIKLMKKRTDFGQAKLIGKISLWFSFLAFVGLLIVFFTVASPSESYQQNIRVLSLSQKTLPWIMLVTGLILTLITGIVTWLVTLFSTFHISGPLFRFSRNIEEWINHGRRNTVPLRKEDALQEESRLMEETIKSHYVYLDELQPFLNQVLQAVDAGDSQQMNHVLSLLKEKVDRATINHEAAH